MSQQGVVFHGPAVIQFEFPSCAEPVMPGLSWGAIDAFPTPAYWAYQVMAQRILGRPIRYRLGATVREEVVACLLGGYGIPADVGLAAFERLKSLGIITQNPTMEDVLTALSEPLLVNDRPVRYRFARQKSKYVALALQRLSDESPPLETGREFRDWLLSVPGIGLKTASWIARNWLDADDVAILDIHLLRAGRLGGFFDSGKTVERDYLELEEKFIQLSHGIGVRPSELDAIIWLEMRSSPSTVRRMLQSDEQKTATNKGPSRRKVRPNKGRSHAHQPVLFE